MAVERPRRVEARPFPSTRRLVTAAMRAGRRKMPMYGLVDVDITTANRMLACHDPPWSLTAFVVASVARAAAAHPVGLDYWIWPGWAAGLGSSLSALLGCLPARSPSARLSHGAGPG